MENNTDSELGQSTTTQLSKNAQKKLAKAARFEELKKERRASEKLKRKQKKRERAEQQQKTEAVQDGEGPRKKAKTDQRPKQPFSARIVVDLGFDDMMSENEVRSLTSQLSFTYSANRKALHPFSTILFTGLSGRTLTRLEGMSDAAYKRWIDTQWWSEGYERLWEETNTSAEEEVRTAGECSKQEDATNAQVGKKSTSRVSKPQSTPRESVVYLTADSSEELTELKEYETYIIGGIVDHNRYKNLCLKKSQDTCIRSARLPIGTYLSELKTRKVLTVNQTFEILLKWVETRDWEHALHSVVPKRKFSEKERGKGSNRVAGGSNDDGGSDQVEDDDKVIVDAEDVEEGREDLTDITTLNTDSVLSGVGNEKYVESS